MAKKLDGRATLSGGSEPFFELYCQPCNEDKRYLEAHGYCQDCQEFLCRDCYDNHRKPRPCRHHVLLNKEKMPKAPPSSNQRTPSDVCTQTCDDHPNEVIKYYCAKHDNIACSVCVTVAHITCGVDYIPDIVKDVRNDEKYKKAYAMLVDTSSKAAETIQRSKKHLSNIQGCYDEALNDFRQLKKEVNEMMDNGEMKMKEKTDDIKSKDTKKMKALIEDSTTVIQETDKLRAQLDHRKDTSHQKCDLFVDAIKAKRKVQHFKRKLTDIAKNNTMTQYAYERPSDVWDYANCSDAYGELAIKSQAAQTPLAFSHVTDISVKIKGDDAKPFITGSVILPDGSIVLVDMFNKTVKLLDTTNVKLVSTKTIDGDPWDITKTGSESVALTLPDKAMIMCLSVGNTIMIDKQIKTSGLCVGIEFSRDIFFVALHGPARLEMLKADGTLLRTIVHADRQREFSNPQYIVARADLVFVSHGSAGNVTIFDRNGHLKGDYSTSNILEPLGLTVGTNGNVFVCGCKSNNIIVFSRDGKYKKILLSEKDGLEGPQSIAYCERTQRLFVTQEYDARLRVYQLQ